MFLASALFVGSVFLTSSPLPEAQIVGLSILGDGAIAIASLMIVFSVYVFRSHLEPPVFHPFFLGFSFLYLSSLLDFLTGFRAVPTEILPFQALMSVLGAGSLVVGFGLWLNRYESRGKLLTENEATLRQRSRQLSLLNRMLQHDLRNDLNVIEGHVQIAREHVDSTGERYLETAKRATGEAMELTRTAGEFMETIFENQRGTEPVELGGVLKGQLERIRESYPEVNLQVGNRPAEPVRVVANEMLGSVLRNLLVNAIVHNDKEVPEITVSVEKQGERIQLRVADNGPGVPEDRKADLFGQGEKGLESSGTGIGLYLVHTLIETYGGDVWIADNDPEGAVFVVELRVAGDSTPALS
ncbi:MAG: sensor histidine kinase [Halodesulfurarchaeum sp.]